MDPSSETPVHQPPPVVVEEEATSQHTTWSPWPELQMPEGEVGAEGPELQTPQGDEDTDDEAEGG